MITVFLRGGQKRVQFHVIAFWGVDVCIFFFPLPFPLSQGPSGESRTFTVRLGVNGGLGFDFLELLRSALIHIFEPSCTHDFF